MLTNEANNDEIKNFLAVLFYTVIVVFDKTEERDEAFSYLQEHNFDLNVPSQFATLKALQQNDIYIACFSTAEAQDSLPMWYMYADHGGGVCLEFDGQGMLDAHQKQFPNFVEQAYAFVTYSIKEFKHGVANFLQSVINFLTQFFEDGNDPEKLNDGDFLYFVSYYIGVAALSFKSPKFEHENEIRILCRVPRNDGLSHVGFCPTPSGAVKAYIPIRYPELSKSLLKRVWLGPANVNEPDLLTIFFSQLAGKLIDVTKSKIPFRNV